MRGRIPLAGVLLALFLVAPAAAAAAQEAPRAWPDGAYNPFGHLPIRVRLDFSNLTEEVRGYEEEVRAALRYWESGGNGALQWAPRFEEVEEAPDIVLWLRDAPHVGPVCGNSSDALGCARPFERPVSVELVMRQENHTYRAYRLVREVAMHELGHALGLPHSDDAGDIMAAHVSRAAATAWRPGDAERLVVGVAVVALVGVASGIALHRAIRTDPRFGALRPLTDPTWCEASSTGEHELETARVRVGRRLETWQVCRRCQRGAPGAEGRLVAR